MQIIDIDGKVLFEDESETIREAVEHAIRTGIDFERADFNGADLKGANLKWANLKHVDFQRTNLWEAKITESQIPDIITGLGLVVSKDGTENEE